MSRLCERCVLEVLNVSSKGIKINKIYYSNSDGSITTTTPKKLMERNDHHISKFFKNNGYKPTLGCSNYEDHEHGCCDCDDSDEDIDAA